MKTQKGGSRLSRHALHAAPLGNLTFRKRADDYGPRELYKHYPSMFRRYKHRPSSTLQLSILPITTVEPMGSVHPAVRQTSTTRTYSLFPILEMHHVLHHKVIRNHRVLSQHENGKRHFPAIRICLAIRDKNGNPCVTVPPRGARRVDSVSPNYEDRERIGKQKLTPTLQHRATVTILSHPDFQSYVHRASLQRHWSW
jgi:hypothetical protein